MIDDWPERIGLPLIEECLIKLDFTAKCLGEEKRQVEGRRQVRAAIRALQRAKRDLRKKP